jgi:hypothetical protein
MSRQLFALLLVTLLLGGCAGSTKAFLTYETSPEGAKLYENGTLIGQAPVMRVYNNDGKLKTIETPDVKAVWPSGAETSFFTILPVGSDRVATLERPANAPGLEGDLQHAKEVAAARKQDEERLKEERRREEARASARCQAQLSGNSKAISDDCRP